MIRRLLTAGRLKGANTFIGGIGATINTAALLSAKFVKVTEEGIEPIFETDIYRFSVDENNNVSFLILIDYALKSDAFRLPTGITYYIDDDGYCTYGVGKNHFRQNEQNLIILPNYFLQANYSVNEFAYSGIELICIPKMVPLGSSALWTSMFLGTTINGNIYVNIDNETGNDGSPDGDIAGAVVWIKYATNFSKPTEVENITTLGTGANYIEIEWPAVTHTNAIDWYLIFADGVYKGKTATTSFTIDDLDADTDYEIKIMVIDEMGNNSHFSEIYVESTIYQAV